MPILTARHWVIGGGVVAVVLAAVALLLAVREREEPTRGPKPLTGPIDDGFVQRPLAPDEMPDAEHGIVFVDVATGQGEFWTVPGALNPEYVVDSSHRWLLLVAPPGAIIADRTSGKSYRLVSSGDQCWQLLASSGPAPWVFGPTPAGLLVLESRCEPNAFAIVDLASDPTRIAREFSLPITTSTSARANTAVDFRNGLLVIVSQDQGPGGQAEDFMVDLGTGQVARLERAERLAAPGGWLELDNIRDRERPVIVGRRLDSSGDLIGRSVVRTTLSPDGRWLAWTDRFLLREPALGPGAPTHWPVVVVADLQRGGQHVLRVARASTEVAERTLGWLSDSSGFLVATPDGFALVRVEGLLQLLPFGPADALGPVPVPAPHDPNLFVFDGRVVDASGSPRSPEVAALDWAGAGPNTTYGLSDDGTELRIVRSMPGGRDFALGVPSALGLPALLQLPPSSDAVQLRVNTGGDNLNIRREPGLGAPIVGQLRDGAQVLVKDGSAESLGGSWCAEACSIAPDHPPPLQENTAWWVHVRTEDGLEGWVRSDFLAWPEANAGALPKAFREFVRDSVAPALAQANLDFFEQRARTERVVCTPANTPPRLGGPACETVGQQFDGFPLGRWGSEGSIVPLQTAMDLMHRLFKEEASPAADKYGGALPRVYAIGVESSGGKPRYATVLTALIHRPPDFAGSGPLRVVLVLGWETEGSEFRLVHMLSAFVLAEVFLEPLEGARSWIPVWERYSP